VSTENRLVELIDASELGRTLVGQAMAAVSAGRYRTDPPEVLVLFDWAEEHGIGRHRVAELLRWRLRAMAPALQRCRVPDLQLVSEVYHGQQRVVEALTQLGVWGREVRRLRSLYEVEVAKEARSHRRVWARRALVARSELRGRSVVVLRTGAPETTDSSGSLRALFGGPAAGPGPRGSAHGRPGRRVDALG
jgi:hypothetical protein